MAKGPVSILGLRDQSEVEDGRGARVSRGDHRMNESEAAPSVEPPILDRSERGGNVGLLVTLALSLVFAAGVFAMLDRTRAEPYVLGLLGLLAVVGVFSLFAGAIG